MSRRFSLTSIPANALNIGPVSYPVLCQVDQDLWIVMEEFSYITDAEEVFKIPVGTLSDLASTPRILWDFLPPFGKYTSAVLLHDDLYRRQYTTKERADQLLAEAMDCSGVAHAQRQIMFTGVRLFGQDTWDSHTRELAEKNRT